jgi:two-component system sensor histidine kinase BaeS
MTTTPWPSAPMPAPIAIGYRPYGPPRPMVGQADMRTRRRADGGVLVAALMGGVAFDVVVRVGHATLGAALAVAAVAVALTATRRLRGIEAVTALAAAPVVGSFLALRSSPWIVGPDVVAVLGLFGLAATLSMGGSLSDLSVPRAVGRAMVVVLHVMAAPGYALGAFAERRLPKGWAPVARGLGIAAPVVFVLGALLASADAVFASFVQLPDVGDLPIHVFAVVVGAWGMTGLVRAADGAEPEPFPGRVPALGAVEATVIVGSVGALLAAFAAAQVAATTGFGDRVLREAGLTYADHARNGFFQLLAVAAITAAVLLLVRAVTPHHTVLAAAGVVVCALTLVVVWVSIHRLHAYEHAYGLTMLRLASTWFAWWIGTIFVVLAARLAGVARTRHWFLGAAAGLALVGLVAWNLANPEAMVVRHDATRADVDLAYLSGLSADAIPDLARVLPADRLAELCDRAHSDDGLAWNASVAAARDALRAVCR